MAPLLLPLRVQGEGKGVMEQETSPSPMLNPGPSERAVSSLLRAFSGPGAGLHSCNSQRDPVKTPWAGEDSEAQGGPGTCSARPADERCL